MKKLPLGRILRWCPWLISVLSLGFIMLPSFAGASSGANLKASSSASSGPLIVNIDNPSFRKLVVAIPTMTVADEKDQELKRLASSGAEELGRLLNFSGLFNIMSEAAYKDLLNKQKPGSNDKGKAKAAADTSAMRGIDVPQWRALGVESLTMGEIERDKDGIVLSLRTVDINRNEVLLGRRYRKVSASEMTTVMRRYGDLILEAYTGKPGIFNSKLLFVGRAKNGEDKHVYLADFDGSNLEALTSGKGLHVSPSWSPDGKFVSFTSYRDGNPDLFSYELATKRMRKISGHAGINSGGTWAPNGKLIAFSGSVGSQVDIYTASPEGSSRNVLIRGSGVDAEAAFSPDGRYLAFVSGRYGNPHIFRATLKWTNDTTLAVTEDKRLTYVGWYNAAPAWSPDSAKLAFAGYDRDIDRFDLFMMNSDGTGLERLTLRAGDNEHPSWSPNGQMIVFASNRIGQQDRKGQAAIYVMNRDGSSQRKLDMNLYDAQQPGWSPQLD